MDKNRIQAILNEDRRSRREPYTAKDFRRDEHYRIFRIDQFTHITRIASPLEYQFFRNPKFRRWDNKVKCDDLDTAVGGRIKTKLFCGYYLLPSGLVMEFLSPYSKALSDSIRCVMNKIAYTSNSERINDIKQRYEQELYERHTRNIVVVDDFQVCIAESDRENATIIDARKDAYLINVISDGHCTESILLKRDSSKPSYRTIYF